MLWTARPVLGSQKLFQGKSMLGPDQFFELVEIFLGQAQSIQPSVRAVVTTVPLPTMLVEPRNMTLVLADLLGKDSLCLCLLVLLFDRRRDTVHEVFDAEHTTTMVAVGAGHCQVVPFIAATHAAGRHMLNGGAV